MGTFGANTLKYIYKYADTQISKESGMVFGT